MICGVSGTHNLCFMWFPDHKPFDLWGFRNAEFMFYVVYGPQTFWICGVDQNVSKEELERYYAKGGHVRGGFAFSVVSDQVGGEWGGDAHFVKFLITLHCKSTCQ